MSELKKRKQLIIEALNTVNANILRYEVTIKFAEDKQQEIGEQPEINQSIMESLVRKEQEERSRKILLKLLEGVINEKH